MPIAIVAALVPLVVIVPRLRLSGPVTPEWGGRAEWPHCVYRDGAHARYVLCDDPDAPGAAEFPACHVHQQDWGVPVTVTAGGASTLTLVLSGLPLPARARVAAVHAAAPADAGRA